MNITIDIILIAIAALIIFRCWRNGLVKSVIGLVCDIVALVVAYALTPLAAKFLCNSVFLDKISAGIDSTVRSAATTSVGVDVTSFLSKIPETLEGTLNKYNVGDDALKNFVSGLSDTGEGAVKKVSEFIAKPTSYILSNAISFIVIFVLALIILRLVSKFIIVLFKAPIIRTADKTAGIILGVVNALFVLWVLSLVISAGVGALGSYIPDWFGDTVEKSVILKFFASHNPISIIKGVLEKVGV